MSNIWRRRRCAPVGGRGRCLGFTASVSCAPWLTGLWFHILLRPSRGHLVVPRPANIIRAPRQRVPAGPTILSLTSRLLPPRLFTPALGTRTDQRIGLALDEDSHRRARPIPSHPTRPSHQRPRSRTGDRSPLGPSPYPHTLPFPYPHSHPHSRHHGRVHVHPVHGRYETPHPLCRDESVRKPHHSL